MNAINPTVVPLEEDSQSPTAELTTKQQLAANAILTGANYPDAAIAANCSLASIKRWVCQPTFKAYVAEGRKAALENAVYDLADGCALSVKTLKRLMVEAESETVRCRAAEAILNNAMRLYELTDIVGRVNQLEIMIGGANK